MSALNDTLLLPPNSRLRPEEVQILRADQEALSYDAGIFSAWIESVDP